MGPKQYGSVKQIETDPIGQDSLRVTQFEHIRLPEVGGRRRRGRSRGVKVIQLHLPLVDLQQIWV